MPWIRFTQMFSIGNDRISQLGQVSFNYMFYDIIKTELIEISKGNNPKYMKEDGSLYDFDYYMGNLAAAFDDIRAVSIKGYIMKFNKRESSTACLYFLWISCLYAQLSAYSL